MSRANTWQAREERRLNKEGTMGRTKVSYYVFAYNHAKTVEAACYAALAQTYSILEVIFSDDCSSDETFKLMERIAKGYNGPHRIILNRNERNLGLIGHVNKLFEIAHGELIIGVSGDDVSVPEQTRKIVQAYEASDRSALLIHSSVVMIDQKGEEIGIWKPPIVTENLTKVEAALSLRLYIGATGAWNRKIYEQFGPITYPDTYEDLILGFRALMEDKICYIDEPLVRYAISGGIAGGPGGKKSTPETLAGRIRFLRRAHSTYAQRRDDLSLSRKSGEDLSSLITSKARDYELRLLFHNNPLRLALLLFTGEFFLAVRSIASGVAFFVRRASGAIFSARSRIETN